MSQILSAATEPVTRTRLIYASFLSNTELRQYIALLIEREMLEVDPITKTKFKITQEGRRFLKLYENLVSITRRSMPHKNLCNIAIERNN